MAGDYCFLQLSVRKGKAYERNCIAGQLDGCDKVFPDTGAVVIIAAAGVFWKYRMMSMPGYDGKLFLFGKLT